VLLGIAKTCWNNEVGEYEAGGPSKDRAALRKAHYAVRQNVHLARLLDNGTYTMQFLESLIYAKVRKTSP
jgi:hypothetical protein